MKDGLTYEEVRDHLRVHRRGGQPCPVCGTRISEITAGQRITSFCRNCQK
jgi:formamidopyrimidine-DNA glycosylase